ncbi:hypothetical protein H6G00_23245 [Leptolyngbya sp. FACHB-541]|uniref:hypothetical protein n=1 Tax=Leptolyngbya sp. FACHB-541 TaxID=2692810 RepID=UPI0016882CF5|nr:hypothetical protein [Leptolyngbya sp. FACHB-541]MBD1999492.1 hypothetical protein [Leptolyngbya sp. FACHB-541]
MPDYISSSTLSCVPSSTQTQESTWQTFEGILQRLHQEGIYIDAEQLAVFFLSHGLPVHLRYVPDRLKQRAIAINQNYQGDMAQLVDEVESHTQD